MWYYCKIKEGFAMATIIKEWEGRASVSIAVEAGKDDMNSEGTHVHVYKRGRRTKTWIAMSGTKGKDLDDDDVKIAEKLFDDNYREIDSWCDRVKKGEFDG